MHEPAICTSDKRRDLYCGKSWKGLFICPVCGKKTWQNYNFLGKRKVVCNGDKFAKEQKQ